MFRYFASPSSGFCSSIELFALGLLVFAFSTAECAATTYYVKETGNDHSDGRTWGSAWRTLEQAGGKARAGDTVIIRKGANPYGYLPIANSGTQHNPIVFRGESDTELPVITGARRITAWSESSHPRIWLTRLKKEPGIVTVDGAPLPKSGDHECSDGRWFWEKQHLYYCASDGRPEDFELWINAAAGGAVIRSKSWIELHNLHFWFGGGAGVSIKNGHHILMSNIRSEWHWRGIDITDHSTHNIVDGCHISNNREGIYLSRGASHNTVRNCVVTRNGNPPRWSKGDRAGLAVGDKGPNRFNLIEDNEVSFNGGPNSDPGLIAYDAPNTTLRRNNVHHNYGSGLYVTIGSHGSTVRNNRVAFNGIPATQSHLKGIAGLSVRVSRDVVVEDNRIIGNHVSPDSRWPGKMLGPKGGLDIQGLPGQDMTNIVLRNNTVSGTVGGPDLFINTKPNLSGLTIIPRQQAPKWYTPPE